MSPVFKGIVFTYHGSSGARHIFLRRDRMTAAKFFPNQVRGLVIAIFVLTLIVSCSHSAVPTDPDSQPSQATTASADNLIDSSNKALWGFYDVTYNPGAGFEVVPLRGPQYTLNVNMFLQPPTGSLSNMQVTIVDDSNVFANGRVIVNVALTHPFAGLDEYTGFDVMGIFINDGSNTAHVSSAIKYANPSSNSILRNADGYTRWMNPNEFTGPSPGGYLDGALGTKNQNWSATVNPYKYYCDNLAATEPIKSHFGSSLQVQNRGMFSAGKTNTRQYDLKFRMSGGLPDLSFQYIILASWIEPTVNPPNNVPGDFPDAANLKEPFHALIDTNGSTAYYNSDADRGGNLIVNVEIFDQAADNNPFNGVENQIDRITVESPNNFIPGATHLIQFTSADWTTSPGSTELSQIFTLNCGAVTPQGPTPSANPIFISIRSTSGTYNTGTGTPYPTGVPSLFQYHEVSLVGYSPTAPGNVTGFSASDGDTSLGNREVELTWNEEPNADTYTIQRRDFDRPSATWSWGTIHTAGFGTTSWTDPNARYSGTENAIDYRIHANNDLGSSPSWSTDTGYPETRQVGIAFWCWASDGSGTNASVPWSVATSDYANSNAFWNDYGFELVMDNSSSFYWVTNPAYRNLTGTEDSSMHAAYGQSSKPADINVYYVDTAGGSGSASYAAIFCPGSFQNTLNTYVIKTPGANLAAVLAHELGHAMERMDDMYLLDFGPCGDPGVFPFCLGDPLHCDDNAQYAGNLMYYTYPQPITYYDLTVDQHIYADEWMSGHETNYPFP